MTILPACVTVSVADELVPVTVVLEMVPAPVLVESAVKVTGLLEPPLLAVSVIVMPGA